MRISTPAKVILSGEHSVLYGAPAIGTPISLFMHSLWSQKNEESQITLHLDGREIVLADAWDNFSSHLQAYKERYDDFLNGHLPIAAVLPAPHDLVTLVFAAFYDRYRPQLSGLSLSIETDIPISSGLGSSSSLIVNLLRGLLKLSGRDMMREDLISFAREIENFQHGVSSGIDIALVSSKQPLVFMREKGVIGTVPTIPSGMVLVNTGIPQVSTGVCVADVRKNFANDNALWQAFAECTKQIQAAFSYEDGNALKNGVMQNQMLLEKIGVVPERVKSFVNACRVQGIAAKVCGAGAVKGDAAGMVWALAEDEGAMRALQDIVRQYGYKQGLYAVAG